MTPAQYAEQRVSFAYGTAKIENERITRDTVKVAADALARIAADEKAPQR
jgi:hypothetical protein